MNLRGCARTDEYSPSGIASTVVHEISAHSQTKPRTSDGAPDDELASSCSLSSRKTLSFLAAREALREVVTGMTLCNPLPSVLHLAACPVGGEG
jgi:hypothetical protein